MDTEITRLKAFAGRQLLLLVMLVFPFLMADAREESGFGDVWAVYGAINYSSWDGLGDVEPVGRGGPFETDGIGIDLGAYVSIARLNSALILAGGEIGLLGFNSDVLFEEDPGTANAESAFEVNHITATIKARFGEPGERYFDVGAGLGGYFSDTKYIDCSVIVSCLAADTGNSTLGGFLDISGTPGLGIIAGARVHFVEFDPIEAVDLGVSSLEGPIFSLYVGWEFSNWRRK